MYSKCDAIVIQRTGEREKGCVDRDDVIGQIIFWFGTLCMFIWWPVTLLALVAMLGQKIWRASKDNWSRDTRFQFKFLKHD